MTEVVENDKNDENDRSCLRRFRVFRELIR